MDTATSEMTQGLIRATKHLQWTNKMRNHMNRELAPAMAPEPKRRRYPSNPCSINQSPSIRYQIKRFPITFPQYLLWKLSFLPPCLLDHQGQLVYLNKSSTVNMPVGLGLKSVSPVRTWWYREKRRDAENQTQTTVIFCVWLNWRTSLKRCSNRENDNRTLLYTLGQQFFTNHLT